MILHYLSHPEVRIDPAVPVPDWGLSERGRERAARFAACPFLRSVEALFCSGERKAVETAAIIAERTGLVPTVVADSHENDRSATGFLPPAEFEATADLFFGRPEESVRGWERAVDAQNRIRRALSAAFGASEAKEVLVVGHGGVGTLLACALAGRPIDRRHDQPAGGGNLFTARWPDGGLLREWTPIEAFA